MPPDPPGNVTDLEALRGRRRVFADRPEAGCALVPLLQACAGTGAIVLGIPAGGVPVAAAIAAALDLALDVAVVSKMTPSWNSEVGYGAVAFDGTRLVNEDLVRRLGLTEAEVEEGVRLARRKVERRLRRLRGDRPMPDLAGRAVILTDDGLASGFTMRCALEAVGRLGAKERIVAVPTAHSASVERVADLADHVYCANLRSGYSFAVADAYRHWRDLDEDEVAEVLAGFRYP